MIKSKYPQDDIVRDGTESLAEPVNLSTATLPVNDGSDPDLDEALMETFPASDPIASGRIA